ncbi:MAG TPA: hypothetical protein VF939_11565 [Puia sp.]
MKKLPITLFALCTILFAQAQDAQDTRLVGVVAFATNTYQDSLAAKDVYATISRLLIQTKRFTVLEIDKWKQTQEEIDRQKGTAFIEQDIVAKGKSLGARILVIGFVKNAELYQDQGLYSARVDYEVRFLDVETGKMIAASSFKGDSETMMNAGAKASKGLTRMIMPSVITGRGNWKSIYLASSAFAAMSDADKKAIKGKLVDAIEATSGKVNAWIRSTFNFNLLFLKAMDEDKKKGVQSVLIEGGEDIGMQEGARLKMVLVTETETSRGRIRDEEPIAELQVEEVRAQTSKCRVISGGKRIIEGSESKNLRIVFN